MNKFSKDQLRDLQRHQIEQNSKMLCGFSAMNSIHVMPQNDFASLFLLKREEKVFEGGLEMNFALLSLALVP